MKFKKIDDYTVQCILSEEEIKQEIKYDCWNEELFNDYNLKINNKNMFMNCKT